ncbi:MAG: zinc-ribbon domain containing protein [Proteobacteria bacterium]|jgi:CxxC-x17-CxxC domain-containing protein|nr:zinc-ribbon domain containing protein [Pseudomonadota bacterium]
MGFEDRKLVCVQCGVEFVFSAGEQEFFAQRGLASEPRRCAACRKSSKQKRSHKGRQQRGEYRSPAFRASAPEHQGAPGRGPRSGPRIENRDYRSPASFDGKKLKGEADYRSPAFAGIDTVDPEDEYRAPGFKEYVEIKPEQEYRAPGFAEYRDRWRDERPTFSITCAACGQKAMVPFLPEEKERPLCDACHRAERAAQLEAERAAAAAAVEASQEPGPTDGCETKKNGEL